MYIEVGRRFNIIAFTEAECTFDFASRINRHGVQSQSSFPITARHRTLNVEKKFNKDTNILCHFNQEENIIWFLKNIWFKKVSLFICNELIWSSAAIYICLSPCRQTRIGYGSIIVAPNNGCTGVITTELTGERLASCVRKCCNNVGIQSNPDFCGEFKTSFDN